MTLLLTNEEADQLIKIIKSIIEKHIGVIKYPSEGKIDIRSFEDDQREFQLIYRFMHEEYIVYQFHDVRTGHSLLRINLNKGFHKNADGEKIKGHRINLFSEEEYYLKNDQKTHMRAFPLPNDQFKNIENPIQLLYDILNYVNVQNSRMVTLSIQSDLDV